MNGGGPSCLRIFYEDLIGCTLLVDARRLWQRSLAGRGEFDIQHGRSDLKRTAADRHRSHD